MVSAYVSGLVLGFVLLAPAFARAQNGPVFRTTNFDFALTATPNETVYVTIVNPRPDPAATAGGNIEFEWKVEEGESSVGEPGLTTIAPGEARTFRLDPRASGGPLDGGSGLRRVVVGFALRAEVRGDAPQPAPSATVELVDRRTGGARIGLLLPAIQAVD
jgi:hypothetical protein